jgi:hypothetical protein
MTLQSTYTAADWDFLGSSSDGTEDIWYKTTSYPVPNGIYLAGDGSLSLPYQVWNASQLCTVLSGSAYLDKKIKLNADISMADVVYPRPAASAATPFTGTFDGSKKIISSLSITSNYDNSSLFGVIGSGGLVKDIGLKNAAISSPGGSYAGGIAGRCDGSIMSCFVTGSIEGESFAGSLAGSLGGLATVSNCYSICDVTVTGQTAGGIAAEISDYASVSGCYAAGGCYGTLAGGIAAAADMTADVDASFYNSDKTIWSIAGTGKNRQEMGESQTYINASWPMGAMWYMLEGGLPLFDWQSLRFDADLNGDSTVDLLDVAAIANDWKQPTYQAKSDIYPDMEINTADVCILAQQWLTGK